MLYACEPRGIAAVAPTEPTFEEPELPTKVVGWRQEAVIGEIEDASTGSDAGMNTVSPMRTLPASG
jgi:hypothetical protein